MHYFFCKEKRPRRGKNLGLYYLIIVLVLCRPLVTSQNEWQGLVHLELFIRYPNLYAISVRILFIIVIFLKEHFAICYCLQAKCIETGETVAIKKVLQDRRYKNRELQLMRTMDNPNIVSLKHCFFSTTIQNELYLNLVMEYVPESMFRVLKHYNDANQRMPLIYVKLYTYQVSK